jgi:hypothetical protein
MESGLSYPPGTNLPEHQGWEKQKKYEKERRFEEHGSESF